MNEYIGHPSQVSRVEELRLVGGKGDGMRLFQLNNGIGTELTVSADRCCDVTRLSFRGVNMSYFAPCGYVAPAYYDKTGSGFLESFTAGFLTTCGLNAAGNSCVDEGEPLPTHGSIGNAPAEHVWWTRDETALRLFGEISDEHIFQRKLRLLREIRLDLTQNEFDITDTLTNDGHAIEPIQMLYHMNIGYPLLDEDSAVKIAAESVTPRNEHAAEDIANCLRMEKPQAGYKERCYYYHCTGKGEASVFQPKLGLGLRIEYDPRELNCFTEWKMMGERDYVLGLEPGNCYPDGRDAMRRLGLLKFIQPKEALVFHIKVRMLADNAPRG